DDSEKAEDSDPSTEGQAEGNFEQAEKFLQGEEKQVQSQQITGGTGQPGARQHACCLQSETQRAERWLHGEKEIIERMADAGRRTSDLRRRTSDVSHVAPASR